MTNRNIQISSEYKAQTTKAIVSIILFVLTYLVVLLISIGLTALGLYIGIMIISTFPSFIGIVLGIVLTSFGFLNLFSLIKFIFTSQKVDRSHLYEINRSEEAVLFNLIDEIVDALGTDFPKKVYLSNDVNASVFYDSNFWSMFFPVKKNLQIGLGLINTVSKTELKAILSHEFGHFSQKSMKVGSYVYNVNNAIFSMLYGSKCGFGIHWILIKLYEIVNKSYLALSREMEFHADEMATTVTGYEPLKNTLLRMPWAEQSFSQVLTFYDEKIAENLKSENIYNEQLFVLNLLAKENNLSFVENLPMVTEAEYNKFNYSKLFIKNQWASHPDTKERIESMKKTNNKAEQIENSPANEIFANIEETQKKLTNMMFTQIQYQTQASSIPLKRFIAEYEKYLFNNSFSKNYNGYYDYKDPICFDVDSNHLSEEKITIEELFSNQKVDLVYTAIALENDIETLKEIANKNIRVKTFDYDCKQYKRKETKSLISKLSLELKQVTDQIKQNDIRVYSFLRNKEQLQKSLPQLKSLYKDFFEFNREFDKKSDFLTKLTNELLYLNVSTCIEEFRATFLKIKRMEKHLKEWIEAMMTDSEYQSIITTEIMESFELYLSTQSKYLQNRIILQDNLDKLIIAIKNYSFILSKGQFLLKKKLLSYQANLMCNTQY
jgi:Zn-dependent protease with chaperone function